MFRFGDRETVDGMTAMFFFKKNYKYLFAADFHITILTYSKECSWCVIAGLYVLNEIAPFIRATPVKTPNKPQLHFFGPNHK